MSPGSVRETGSPAPFGAVSLAEALESVAPWV